MKFPLISDIATTTVVSMNISGCVNEALELMLEKNHRDVIVFDKDKFRIITVVDILHLQKEGLDFSTPLSTLNLAEVPTILKDKNVIDTLEFLSDDMQYLCAIYSDGTLYGLVNHTDITSNIDPDILMDNYRLRDLIKQNRKIEWVCKEELVSSLLDKMLHKSFDHVVIAEDMKPIGILTTKDIVKLIKNVDDLNQPIQKYMSSPLDTINDSASIKSALEFVKSKHYKRVVVVNDKGELTGIITQKELISLTYSRWAMLMKEYQEELSEINHMLESKNREYEVLASTDSLTGLYNRYKFSELYLSAYTVMRQRNNNMSLCILDIDHFKSINDTYGHNAGDDVLIQLANTLLRVLRTIDIVCRWGGEEFMILFPTASLENTKELAYKLREEIMNLDLGVVGRITASFGVSEVKESDSMESVIERADKALYLAKRSGRNCVKTELDT